MQRDECVVLFWSMGRESREVGYFCNWSPWSLEGELSFFETAVPPKSIYIGNAIKKTIVSGKVKDCIDSLRSIVFLLFEVHSNCERQSDFPDCHTAFMGLRDLAFPSVPKILQKWNCDHGCPSRFCHCCGNWDRASAEAPPAVFRRQRARLCLESAADTNEWHKLRLNEAHEMSVSSTLRHHETGCAPQEKLPPRPPWDL